MMKSLVVVKLGGAALTDKRGYRALRPDALQRLCLAVATFYLSVERRSGAQLVLVHGAGSFGHADARGAALSAPNRKLDASAVAGVAITRASLALLHAEILAALTACGVPALTVPAFPAGDYVAAARRALDAGFLPVLHGDVVLLEQGPTTTVRIMSGDEIVSTLLTRHADLGVATHLRAVMVTGVDGVFTAPPDADRAAALISRVVVSHAADGAVRTRSEVDRGDDSPDMSVWGPPHAADAHDVADVTGGIAAKLEASVATVAALHASDCEVFIVGAAALPRCLCSLAASDEAGDPQAYRGTQIVYCGGDDIQGDASSKRGACTS
jgi:isopentenyl phosphate kinase